MASRRNSQKSDSETEMQYNSPTNSSLEDNPDVLSTHISSPPVVSPGLSTPFQSFHFASQSDTSKDDASRKHKSYLAKQPAR